MALLNPTLGDLRGSVAGNTFSRNRFGAYVRQKVTPVNPMTDDQVLARNGFGNASTDWSDIAAPQRSAWEAYAAATPFTNIFGNQYFLTGHQMFVRTNSVRNRYGIGAEFDAPTSPGEAAAGQVASASTIRFTDSASTSPNSLLVDLTAPEWLDGWVPTTNALFIYFWVSNRLSAGTNFYDGPWRSAGIIEGDSVTPPTSFSFDLGFALTVGERFRARWRLIDTESRLSPTAVEFNAVENVI